MVTCPHCGRPAMTLGRKAGLAPGRVIPCQACGKPVMTHSIGVFTALLPMIAGFYFLRTGSILEGVAAIIAAVGCMALLQTFAVPLAKPPGS